MGVIKVAEPPKAKNMLADGWSFIKSLLQGMRHTLVVFLRQLSGVEKSQTLEWPEEPATYGERFKGKHFLTRRDDGKIRCTACFLCATNCPAQCIHIEAGQTDDKTIEKFPVRFEIDILRCVFCGYCEEACPVDAIRLGPEYAMVGYTADKWVYTKDYLTDRKQLHHGVVSVKEENPKHETIKYKEVDLLHYHSFAPHGGQHHHQ